MKAIDKTYGPKYDSDMPAEHKTAETRDLHSIDRRLRAAGYRIAFRPKGKEPTWMKNGVLFPQREALKRIAATPEPAGSK